MSFARRGAALSLVALLVLIGSAHIGSPDTWFEGPAGPYAVRVLIRSPQVIPARAEIVVRILSGGPVDRVSATPRIWNGGEKGAPPSDDAARVPGDSSLWSVMLWFMRQGSYGVIVRVHGAAGEGTATVPYTAVASSVLGMRRGLGALLAALGAFLAFGLITIVGAGTREATLAPGERPDETRAARAARAKLVAAIVIVLALAGGRVWWNHEQRAYAASIFKPMSASVSVRPGEGGPVLRLAIDSIWAIDRFWALVPDHGKLMHLFLIKEDDLGAFAHLHPVARDSLRYESRLPPLPEGRYRVFADVVHESGLAETMVQSVELPAPGNAARAPSDSDDAAFARPAGGAVFRADDGSSLTWEHAGLPRVAGQDAGLLFTLKDRSGAPLSVEPYLGMAAHAVVARDDGGVFVHLHPSGTVSFGAQQVLASWTPADSTRGAMRAKLMRQDSAMGAMRGGMLPGEFEIPYAFPSAGRYRIWVQWRRSGAVHTAAFDVTVGAG